MPNEQTDVKFLKYKTKILAINTGDKDDTLDHDIIVPEYRGYKVGDRIPAGTSLKAIIEKEFNSTAPTYPITIQKTGNGTVSPNGPTVNVTEGEDFTINSAVPDGGWVLDSVTVDGTAVTLPYTIQNVTGPHTVRVVFKEQTKLTVTPQAGEHGSIVPNTVGQFNDGDSLRLEYTAVPAAGYQVKDWFRNGVSLGVKTTKYLLTETIHEHIIIKVEFEEIPVEVYHLTVKDNTTGLTNYGTINPAVGTYDTSVGETTSVVATPNAGFKIKSFKVEGTEQTIADPTKAFTYALTAEQMVKDASTTVEVEFEEVKEVMYDAYVQTSRSAGWAKPTVDNLTLGTPIDIIPAELAANGYSQTVPKSTAQRYVIPVLIYPKAAGTITSIKEGDVTESITAFTVGDTITINGVEYYMTYSNTVNTTSLATPTSFMYRW